MTAAKNVSREKQTVWDEEGNDLPATFTVEQITDEDGVERGQIYHEFRLRTVTRPAGRGVWKLVAEPVAPLVESLAAERERVREELEKKEEDLTERLVRIARPYVKALREDWKHKDQLNYPWGGREPEYMHGEVYDVRIYRENGVPTASIELRTQGCSCCGDDYHTLKAPLSLLNAGPEAIADHFAKKQREREEAKAQQKEQEAQARAANEKKLYEQLKEKFEGSAP